MRIPPDAYVFAHVSGLLPNERQRQLMVILQAFIDDSAANRRHGPGLFMLGGLIASVEQWAAFSIEWQDKLDEAPGLEYFKLSEAAALKGQFDPGRGWTPKARNRRVAELTEIARRHSIMGIACLMPQEPYDEFIKGFVGVKELQDPYFICFYRIVDAITTARADLPSDELQYIFDEQGATGTRALGYWSKFRTSLLWKRPDLIGSMPKHESDKKFRPLQAADLYAGLRRIYAEESRTITPDIAEWAEPLLGFPEIIQYFNRDQLMEFGAHLVIKSATS